MEKNKERTFTPPFMVQLTSGEHNEHCDKYPHGSLRMVKQDVETKRLWMLERIDSIPDRFKTAVVDPNMATKQCPTCKNIFPEDWPFMNIRQDNSPDTCIRCYERKYLVNRDEYRQILLDEFKRQYKI